VDVLHRINGVRVDQAILGCAEQRDVPAITMPVLPPTIVVIQKLRSLGEHHCDFVRLLPAVRAVRERLDWDRIDAVTADNDHAVAFLVLAGRLGLTG
jgi:urea transporter